MTSVAGSVERQWRCQQTLTALFRHLDDKRYENVVDMFVEDGVWQRPGVVLAGRAEIMADMRKRSATRLSRHVLANFLVIEEGDELEALATLTTYAFDTASAAEMPQVIDGPMGIYSARAQFTETPAGTRLRRLELGVEFTFGKRGT
ncbi:MAG TPA: nuclear transport factor 2 family protein [Ramlibacter sp.]|nr:nuclear transport factor 2 family protein [Ramlibacter sp.]